MCSSIISTNTWTDFQFGNSVALILPIDLGSPLKCFKIYANFSAGRFEIWPVNCHNFAPSKFAVENVTGHKWRVNQILNLNKI